MAHSPGFDLNHFTLRIVNQELRVGPSALRDCQDTEYRSDCAGILRLQNFSCAKVCKFSDRSKVTLIEECGDLWVFPSSSCQFNHSYQSVRIPVSLSTPPVNLDQMRDCGVGRCSNVSLV